LNFGIAVLGSSSGTLTGEGETTFVLAMFVGAGDITGVEVDADEAGRKD
jgi:hypothetical protein